MKLRIKNCKLTLQVIGWLQIIGGITGIGLMASLMLNTGQINGPILLILLIGLALFSFSIFCGTKLLQDERKKSAIILTIINQALQMVHWSFYGYAFVYSSGAELSVGLKGVELDFTLAALISRFSMSINSGDNFSIKVNLVAILVAYVLFDISKEMSTEDITATEPEDVKVLVND